MKDRIFLKIVEEYGYRDWYAILTKEEFESLRKRWQTMKGLNCLVPVQFIVPQAKSYDSDLRFQPEDYQCYSAHIHQCDDSYLETVDYEIPESDFFEMDGKRYSEKDVHDLFMSFLETS